MVNLDERGARVCVLGPSNSGKSTLATAIGRARGLPAVNLDQHRFLPGTQWRMRPDDEFAALHDSAVNEERWVVDGNYSSLLSPRLERATGAILLDASAVASLVRNRDTFDDLNLPKILDANRRALERFYRQENLDVGT